jgi:hypothetical protein
MEITKEFVEACRRAGVEETCSATYLTWCEKHLGHDFAKMPGIWQSWVYLHVAEWRSEVGPLLTLLNARGREDITNIRECHSLVWLDATGSGITNLSGCPNLISLYAADGMTDVSCCPLLVTLDVGGSGITDVSRCPGLNVLVDHKGAIPKTQIDALRKRGCVVHL